MPKQGLWHEASYQKPNRYAVVGIMPLVRTWVITDYLFPLADLLYLARDGIDSSHASCMIIFELVFFFLHIIFSSFHPFTFRFPALPNAQPLRCSERNGSQPWMGCYELIVIPNKRIVWPIKPLLRIFSLHAINTCQSTQLILSNPITTLSFPFC